jgi:hypothetical protein
MGEITHEQLLDDLHEQTRREWRKKIMAMIAIKEVHDD